MAGKILFILGLGAGYVLGTAGRPVRAHQVRRLEGRRAALRAHPVDAASSRQAGRAARARPSPRRSQMPSGAALRDAIGQERWPVLLQIDASEASLRPVNEASQGL